MKVYILMRVYCMTDYSEIYAVFLNEQEAQVQAKSLTIKIWLVVFIICVIVVSIVSWLCDN